MKVVNIFKQYKVNELSGIQGKVLIKQDKFLNRRVIALEGNVTTAAVLTIPCNLHKNYVNKQKQIFKQIHVQANVESQHIFMINVSVVKAGQNYTISISNLYKGIKFPNENSIQVPCQQVQWGTIIVDTKSFYPFDEIVKIQISGAISLKDIFNSNEEILEPEFKIKPVSNQPAGKTIMIRQNKIEQKENKNQNQKNKSQNKKEKQQELQGPKSILKKSKYMSPLGPREDEPQPEQNVSPTKQEEFAFKEIELDPNNFELLPSPLMTLKHIHGYTPYYQANLRLLDDAYFAYPCQNQLIIMNHDNLEQKYCSTNLPIAAIAVHKHNVILACENKKFYANHHESAPSEIVIFDFISCTKQAHYQLDGYYGIVCIDTIDDYILVCALDNQQRFSLLYIQNDVVQIKQVSPFHIQNIKFVNKDLFITCGRENIRYWNVKHDTLTFQGHTPYLGNYTRESFFTDILLTPRRILASCKKGRIFQFIDKELTGVWQISDTPITQVTQFDQFIITTHKDGVRFWKLDFSEVVRFIQSDVEVIGCDSSKVLLCAFKNKSIAKVKTDTFQFLVHSHQQDIIDIQTVGKYIITSSLDHNICIWNQDTQLQYQFKCLDGIATSIAKFKSNIIVAFDNGLIRVFDLNNFSLQQEMDTKSPVSKIVGSQQDHLYICCHESDTILLNHQLQIIKTLKFNKPFTAGFNTDLFYIASKEHIKIYSQDTLLEKFHLNIQIDSVDLNDEHLLLASDGNLKRFDTQMNFLQELVTKVSYVKASGNYVFCGGDQFMIFDYLFRGDNYGTPSKQIYNQPIRKIAFLDDNTIASFIGDFIFIWEIRGNLNNQTYNIGHPTQRDKLQQFEIIQEAQKVKKQQLEKEPKADKTKRQTQIDLKKVQEEQQKKEQRSNQKGNSQINDKLQSPKQSPKLDSPIKKPGSPKLVIEDQIPKININSVRGYCFESTAIQQFAWNRKQKFYVLPAVNFLTINFLNEESNQNLVLTDKILGIQQYVNGIVIINPMKLKLFNNNMEYTKTIDYAGILQCASISLCGNYIALILDQTVQIIELSSGRILTQSIIQRGQSHTYIEWCSKQDLMFVLLTGYSSQLWRVNQRALLEYCDIEIQQMPYRSSANFDIGGKSFIIIAGGSRLSIIDIRTARAIVTVDNVVNQEIIQIIASQRYILLLTNSINIYFYPMSPTLDLLIKSIQEKPQILSLDSQPVGYTDLDNDIMIATRSSIWYVDLKDKVTLKIQNTIPQNECALAVEQNIIGSSEGSILIGMEEILVPKRQCLCLEMMNKILFAAFDDGYLRLFKDFKLIGQIKVGKIATSVKCLKSHFLVSNEAGQIYYCTGEKEIKMREIQNAEFYITSIDAFEETLGYSTGNQKVQILLRKHNEEFNIKKQKVEDEPIQYYLIDSYRFRSIDPAIMKFSKTQKDQVIMACNQIVVRNFIEHLNIYIIDTNVLQFGQIEDYIVVGRSDGSLSLYDNEIELDKIQLGQKIHLIKDRQISFGNLVCQI